MQKGTHLLKKNKTGICLKRNTLKAVDDQIAWYNKKSAINKKYHLILKLIIVFSALFPLQLVTNLRANLVRYTIAIWRFNCIFTGLSTLYKFQDKWSNYRMIGKH